ARVVDVKQRQLREQNPLNSTLMKRSATSPLRCLRHRPRRSMRVRLPMLFAAMVTVMMLVAAGFDAKAYRASGAQLLGSPAAVTPAVASQLPQAQPGVA